MVIVIHVFLDHLSARLHCIWEVLFAVLVSASCCAKKSSVDVVAWVVAHVSQTSPSPPDCLGLSLSHAAGFGALAQEELLQVCLPEPN